MGRAATSQSWDTAQLAETGCSADWGAQLHKSHLRDWISSKALDEPQTVESRQRICDPGQ